MRYKNVHHGHIVEAVKVDVTTQVQSGDLLFEANPGEYLVTMESGVTGVWKPEPFAAAFVPVARPDGASADDTIPPAVA